jgi:hypothetical protein
MRSSTIPQRKLPRGHHRPPDEWEVATTGQGAVAAANAESNGASGS